MSSNEPLISLVVINSDDMDRVESEASVTNAYGIIMLRLKNSFMCQSGYISSSNEYIKSVAKPSLSLKSGMNFMILIKN